MTSKPLGTGLRTSPVVRGKYILENLFNQKIPPPPPDVPPLKVDDNHPLTGTTRQIFEQHRTNPVCAGCHARMEPYGFALENYAGNGAWRSQENGIPLDVSGEINGHKFTNPAEFRKVLETRKDDFRHAVVRKVLSYALGRGIQGTDRPAIEQIVAQVGAEGDTFNSVILNVVKSFPFQNARGGAVNAADRQARNQAQSGLQPVSLSIRSKQQMMIKRPSTEPPRPASRGAGSVAIALPFLDAMIPESLIGSAEAAARTAKAMPKNRFALLYYPNGLESDHWYPEGPTAPITT